jgi:hypothetical protein
MSLMLTRFLSDSFESLSTAVAAQPAVVPSKKKRRSRSKKTTKPVA